MKYKTYILLFCVLLFSAFVIAEENLDELEARSVSRQSANTFYPGEDSSPSYSFQPMTMCYRDITTGNEVWRMANTPNRFSGWSEEYGHQSAFSADGKRLALAMDLDCSAWTSDEEGRAESVWFTLRADGSELRCAEDFITRNWRHREYFGWSPTEVDTAYQIGGLQRDDETYDAEYLYKAVVEDDDITVSQYITFTEDTNKWIWKGFTGDGRKTIVTTWKNSDPLYTVTLLPYADRGIEATWSYMDQSARNYDDHWGYTFAGENGSHDGDSNELVMEDSGESWTINEWAGKTIKNITDGSEGTVESNTATTVTLEDDDLSGGDDDDWDAGDVYLIGVSMHNQRIGGSADAGYWIYMNQDIGDGRPTWWRFRLEGSAADDGPMHTVDTDPSGGYTWFNGTSTQTEMQPLGDSDSGTDNCPWADDSDGDTDPTFYLSHPSLTMDAGIFLFHNVEASGHIGVCSAYDYDNAELYEGGANGLIGSDGSYTDGQHTQWNAWSDYAADWPTRGPTYAVFLANAVRDDTYDICHPHEEGSGDDDGVNQSPDGTKLLFGSSFLNEGNDGQDHQDVFMVVAYYPYPPEVTSCNAVTDTVTVQFDWRLDQASPRSYTSRGWTDHNDGDDPPPPRETELFRLWRSSNGSTGWTAIKTVNADIWDADDGYDFIDGVWNGDGYWVMTDAPGNGTWYYAVTSKEWSGLESVRLSNVFKVEVDGVNHVTGSQDTAYPSELVDGITSCNFYSTNPVAPTGISSAHKATGATADGQYTIDITIPTSGTDLFRYVNIYAEDGSTPTATQQNRIASIPINEFSSGEFTYVDWLGNTAGNTAYGVTIVDTLGNESLIASGEAPEESDTIVDIENPDEFIFLFFHNFCIDCH